MWCVAPLEMNEENSLGARVQSAYRLQCRKKPHRRPLTFFLFNITYRTIHKHYYTYNYCKGKAIPVQVYCRPIEFLEVEASRFVDTRPMKVVRLSALRAGHLNPPPPPRKCFWYLFPLEAESTPGP